MAINDVVRDEPATGEQVQATEVDGKPVYIPEGFESVEAFVTHAREEFDADAQYDRLNRDAALEDLKFVAGDQWDELVKADRTNKGRPCLTINVLPQFIGQVIGDRRINKVTIKVRPKKDATVAQAEVRAGIIKGIEAQSRAERVYDAACEDQVTCGISNFRIDLDYAENDVFEQDIFIRHIPNPLAVIWDRMAVDPTGRDAGHCFVQDTIPRKVYDRQYPEYPCPSELGDGMILTQGWFDNDVVRVTEYWRIITKQRTLAFMMDGDIKDVTDMAPEDYADQLWRGPNGETKIRQAPRTYAQMHLITGFAILSGPYELPLSRLPIIRVEGRVARVGEDRLRYGLVRFAKDSQRMKNYMRSVAVETLAMAPKAVWTGPAKAFDGREDEWRKGHLTGDPLLIHNDEAPTPPQRVDPAPIPAALLQESQLNQQDIKDTTGLHDASLGMRSNEISGRAIQARQREGDVATIIYHDNLNNAIQEGGSVINELIPVAYDTMRTLRTVGADDRDAMVVVNDPNDENSPDITSGKYEVAIETGPSFTTQRQEAAEAMMNAIQVAPQLMQVAGDLIVKAQDWPGAQEISERLKGMMKSQMPGLFEDEEGGDQVDPAMQQQQQMAQAAQMAQLQEAAAQMEQAAAMRELELEKERAAVEKEQASARKAEADARRAESDADKAEIELRLAPVRAGQEMRQREEGHSAKLDRENRTTESRIQSQQARGAGPRPAGDRKGNPPARKEKSK